MKRGKRIKAFAFILIFSLFFLEIPMTIADNTNQPNTEEAVVENWRVSVGPIMLKRKNNADTTLVITRPAFVPSLRASDLDSDFQIGPEVIIAYRFNNVEKLKNFEIEGRWFKIFEVLSDTNATRVRRPLIPYKTPLGNDGIWSYSADYKYDLQNAELNFRWLAKKKITLLAGPRFIGMDEKLNIMGTRLTGTPFPQGRDHSIQTKNRLIGAQLGIDANLFETPMPKALSLDVWGRAGYYNNDISTHTRMFRAPAGTVLSCDADENKGSFVGEVGVNAKIKFNSSFMLIAGYEFLWIQDAALASAQIAVSDPSNATASVATDSVYYHGAKVAFQFRW